VTNLDDFAALSREVDGLAVVSTVRADATVQSSLVNVGVLPSPFDRRPNVAFVSYGKVKLANLRARPQLSLTTRSGWRWCTVEGRATLVGPDDPRDGVDSEALRLLLRAVFLAAGGSHDNWAEYDRTMLEQRRAAVLVEPTRVYGS
jgi:PPOX class probable F420-dependent enzyme